MIFTEPVDMTDIATICIMPPHLSHLRAEANLRESDTDYLEIECLQIAITETLSGDPAECAYDPTGADGYLIIFGNAPQFTQILTQV